MLGGGGWGGEVGVWEVAAPDADPLKEEQRGEAAEKTLKIAAETQKSVKTSRGHATRAAAPQFTHKIHICFS